MKTYIIILFLLFKTSLNLQAGFNYLYNVNYPYTSNSDEIMKFKDKLYIVNTDEQFLVSFMILDSIGNYTISYLPYDSVFKVANFGAGMVYYKDKIIVSASCIKSDSIYPAFIIMDTNFVYQKIIFFRTGKSEHLEHLIVVGDELVMKVEKSDPSDKDDSRFIKLDSNYNILWNRLYYDTKTHSSNLKMTTDSLGNIIYNEFTDSTVFINSVFVKLDKNTGLPISRSQLMHRTTFSNNYYILFSTSDHRIVVSTGYSLDIYDEDFNLLTYKSGIYWKGPATGFEVDDGFVFYGASQKGGYFCKTDKNANILWERFILNDTVWTPSNGEGFFNGCRGFGDGYVFCGFSYDPAGWQSAWVVSLDSVGCWGAGDSCNNKYYYSDTFSSVGIAPTPNPPEGSGQEGNWFRVYPNPSSDYINIEVSRFKYQDTREIKFEIYDALGRSILPYVMQEETSLNGEMNFKININEFSKGIYFIKVVDKENRVIGNARFFKE